MRNELACLAAMLLAMAQVSVHISDRYRIALPGYHYEFPSDHFNHSDFQTEWWYYTGNLQTIDGHRFGFELTFFRQGIDCSTWNNSPWDVCDLYLAHLALSDLTKGAFYHSKRMNRAGPEIAGASKTEQRVWNGNWRIQWHGDDQELDGVDESFALHFKLYSAKPPIIHGERGVSQKDDPPGHASHYISLTRLITTGNIQLNHARYQISGTAWMDHEFFTSQLAPEQTGWDWFSIQLNDDTELMLFRIRRNDGSIDAHSSGTFVDADGQSTHLKQRDFTLEPVNNKWTSPTTGGVYPVHWKISVARLNIALEVNASLKDQELTGQRQVTPTYWEGAIQLRGKKGAKPIGGVGYLEMTGYDHPLSGNL